MNLSFTKITVLLFFLCTATCAEAQVYKWTDEKGIVQYSTTPHHPDQAPAELPNITREDFSARIKEIQKSAPQTCDKHGGIDCSQGPDKDGSVICVDGSREANLPFQFSCLEVQLEPAELTLVDADGSPIEIARMDEAIEGQQGARALQISIRNPSAVEAFGVQVTFSFGEKDGVKASGPESVPAYGIADYTVVITEPFGAKALDETGYQIDCTNCRSPIHREKHR